MTMELQLGLALPSPSCFDLNAYVFEPNQPTKNHSKRKRYVDDDDNDYDYEQDEQSSCRAVPRTLPLLLSWNRQPNDDQDPPPHHNDPSFPVINKNDEDGVVVGWPPIKSWRKKLCHRIHGGAGRDRAENVCRRRLNSNSKYVKVKMEGVGIARKIDLSRYDSYQTLMDTLTAMFCTYCGNNSGDAYKLAYQDGEGDWLLAADVPWRTFMRNVQRLKLVRRRRSSC